MPARDARLRPPIHPDPLDATVPEEGRIRLERADDRQWIPAEQQEDYFDAIPEEHRPFFRWPMLHLGVSGEAFALHKTDYDVINNAFIIRRSVSARTMIQQTKTRKVHVIPCADEFTETAKRLINQGLDSPYLFVNPMARKDGRATPMKASNIIWKVAWKTPGSISHSTMGSSIPVARTSSSMGGTVDELQIMTDHARRESVLKYADISLKPKAGDDAEETQTKHRQATNHRG